jgi:transcriptional regulator with XRE-family HTH domain
LTAPASQPEFFFAVALRRARNEAEVTQEALARKIGMEPSEVSDIESGKRSPHLRTIKRLTDGLGIAYWRLMRLAAELEAGIPWDEVAWPPSD